MNPLRYSLLKRIPEDYYMMKLNDFLPFFTFPAYMLYVFYEFLICLSHALHLITCFFYICNFILHVFYLQSHVLLSYITHLACPLFYMLQLKSFLPKFYIAFSDGLELMLMIPQMSLSMKPIHAILISNSLLNVKIQTLRRGNLIFQKN